MRLDLAAALGEKVYTRFSSKDAPANHCRFDTSTGSYALPGAVIPPTQEWNDIRADMILAKEFKALTWRRSAFMSEIIDALLSCTIVILIIPSISAGRCGIRHLGD
jgi:hypothetical protein